MPLLHVLVLAVDGPPLHRREQGVPREVGEGGCFSGIPDSARPAPAIPEILLLVIATAASMESLQCSCDLNRLEGHTKWTDRGKEIFFDVITKTNQKFSLPSKALQFLYHDFMRNL